MGDLLGMLVLIQKKPTRKCKGYSISMMARSGIHGRHQKSTVLAKARNLLCWYIMHEATRRTRDKSLARSYRWTCRVQYCSARNLGALELHLLFWARKQILLMMFRNLFDLFDNPEVSDSMSVDGSKHFPRVGRRFITVHTSILIAP
jgi:hypothetical protein